MKPSVEKVLAEAKAFAEQKKKEGWTREDFVKALREMMHIRNNNVFDCLFCGAEHPISHVAVFNSQGKRVGRICAKHTFYEIITNSTDFFVSIEKLGTKKQEEKKEEPKNFQCNYKDMMDMSLWLHEVLIYVGATYNNIAFDGDKVTIVGLEKKE